MTGPKLCLAELWPGGPRCVLNAHEDADRHGFTVNVRRALVDEALDRADRLGWRSISTSRLLDLRAGRVDRLPPRPERARP